MKKKSQASGAKNHTTTSEIPSELETQKIDPEMVYELWAQAQVLFPRKGPSFAEAYYTNLKKLRLNAR